jgi:hypothetical protein
MKRPNRLGPVGIPQPVSSPSPARHLAFPDPNFRPPDTEGETCWRHCSPHSHCADSIRTPLLLPPPLPPSSQLALFSTRPPPTPQPSRLPSPCLALRRHPASLRAVTLPRSAPSPCLALGCLPPPLLPEALGAGRTTTKSLRWPSAVIEPGIGGPMRTQSPSLQWRVASDGG